MERYDTNISPSAPGGFHEFTDIHEGYAKARSLVAEVAGYNDNAPTDTVYRLEAVLPSLQTPGTPARPTFPVEDRRPASETVSFLDTFPVHDHRDITARVHELCTDSGKSGEFLSGNAPPCYDAQGSQLPVLSCRVVRGTRVAADSPHGYLAALGRKPKEKSNIGAFSEKYSCNMYCGSQAVWTMLLLFKDNHEKRPGFWRPDGTCVSLDIRPARSSRLEDESLRAEANDRQLQERGYTGKHPFVNLLSTDDLMKKRWESSEKFLADNRDALKQGWNEDQFKQYAEVVGVTIVLCLGTLKFRKFSPKISHGKLVVYISIVRADHVVLIEPRSRETVQVALEDDNAPGHDDGIVLMDEDELMGYVNTAEEIAAQIAESADDPSAKELTGRPRLRFESDEWFDRHDKGQNEDTMDKFVQNRDFSRSYGKLKNGTIPLDFSNHRHSHRELHFDGTVVRHECFQAFQRDVLKQDLEGEDALRMPTLVHVHYAMAQRVLDLGGAAKVDSSIDPVLGELAKASMLTNCRYVREDANHLQKSSTDAKHMYAHNGYTIFMHMREPQNFHGYPQGQFELIFAPGFVAASDEKLDGINPNSVMISNCQMPIPGGAANEEAMARTKAALRAAIKKRNIAIENANTREQARLDEEIRQLRNAKITSFLGCYPNDLPLPAFSPCTPDKPGTYWLFWIYAWDLRPLKYSSNKDARRYYHHMERLGWNELPKRYEFRNPDVTTDGYEDHIFVVASPTMAQMLKYGLRVRAMAAAVSRQTTSTMFPDLGHLAAHPDTKHLVKDLVSGDDLRELFREYRTYMPVLGKIHAESNFSVSQKWDAPSEKDSLLLAHAMESGLLGFAQKPSDDGSNFIQYDSSVLVGGADGRNKMVKGSDTSGAGFAVSSYQLTRGDSAATGAYAHAPGFTARGASTEKGIWRTVLNGFKDKVQFYPFLLAVYEYSRVMIRKAIATVPVECTITSIKLDEVGVDRSRDELNAMMVRAGLMQDPLTTDPANIMPGLFKPAKDTEYGNVGEACGAAVAGRRFGASALRLYSRNVPYRRGMLALHQRTYRADDAISGDIHCHNGPAGAGKTEVLINVGLSHQDKLVDGPGTIYVVDGNNLKEAVRAKGAGINLGKCITSHMLTMSEVCPEMNSCRPVHAEYLYRSDGPNKKFNNKVLNLRQKGMLPSLRGYHTLIIDEASLIDTSILRSIFKLAKHRRLRVIVICDMDIENDIFLQLSGTGNAPKTPSAMFAAIAEGLGITAEAVSAIFSQNTTAFTKIHRQGTDNSKAIVSTLRELARKNDADGQLGLLRGLCGQAGGSVPRELLHVPMLQSTRGIDGLSDYDPSKDIMVGMQNATLMHMCNGWYEKFGRHLPSDAMFRLRIDNKKRWNAWGSREIDIMLKDAFGTDVPVMNSVAYLTHARLRMLEGDNFYCRFGFPFGACRVTAERHTYKNRINIAGCPTPFKLQGSTLEEGSRMFIVVPDDGKGWTGKDSDQKRAVYVTVSRITAESQVVYTSVSNDELCKHEKMIACVMDEHRASDRKRKPARKRKTKSSNGGATPRGRRRSPGVEQYLDLEAGGG